MYTACCKQEASLYELGVILMKEKVYRQKKKKKIHSCLRDKFSGFSGKWKNNANSEFKWKPIKNFQSNYCTKLCEIFCLGINTINIWVSFYLALVSLKQLWRDKDVVESNLFDPQFPLASSTPFFPRKSTQSQMF